MLCVLLTLNTNHLNLSCLHNQILQSVLFSASFLKEEGKRKDKNIVLVQGWQRGPYLWSWWMMTLSWTPELGSMAATLTIPSIFPSSLPMIMLNDDPLMNSWFRFYGSYTHYSINIHIKLDFNSPRRKRIMFDISVLRLKILQIIKPCSSLKIHHS